MLTCRALLMLALSSLALSTFAEERSLGSQGIVVPKRSALIGNLNEQFKQRANKTASSSPVQRLSSWLVAPTTNSIGGQAQHVDKLRKQQTLYLDRHQQELLAANPNLALNSPLKPAVADLTRASQQLSLREPANSNYADLNQRNLQPNSQHQTAHPQATSGPSVSNAIPSSQQQHFASAAASQSYRGYSLIELDIRSESDRRFVQELYANLSAALNEQAQSGSNSPTSVSPYVDVDFWSFGRQQSVVQEGQAGPRSASFGGDASSGSTLNDQIDIMVSPKSRAFLLGQLNRVKIRHRIKIDDIQARIDKEASSSWQTGSGFAVQQAQARAQAASSFAADASKQYYSLATDIWQPAQNQLSVQAGSSYTWSGSKRESSLHARQANPLEPPQTSSGSGGTSGGDSGSISNAGQPTKPLNETMFFENYQRLAEINQFLESAAERNRDIAQVKVIGRSSQGRHLRVLKLGFEQQEVEWLSNRRSPSSQQVLTPNSLQAQQESTSTPRAPLNASQIFNNFMNRQQSVEKLGSIWLDGGTHAREWISPSTVLYMASRLINNHKHCSTFFNTYRSLVAQLDQLGNNAAANFSARPLRSTSSQQQVDPSLHSSINEINTSLLDSQRPIKPLRPRTELEQALELLAKSPQLVASEHGCDLETEQLLRRYTFFIMPVLNPDGYEYSHTNNRLWRKTRSVSSHPIYRHFCLGADPNRNYDVQHGTTGSSSHPCSQTYAGATPFTEPETRHQSNFVYANRFGMKMYISYHSYSQMILLPLSHSKQVVPDLKDLESVANAGAKAIEQLHGTQYRVGQSAAILYTASGTASDWAYEKANIKYSYTIELRDTGNYGFLLPRQQILPTGEETFNGLLAMIAQMEKNDNLLTSKSTPVGHKLSGDLNQDQVEALNKTTADYNQASQADLEQLSQHSLHRSRPILENVLASSQRASGALSSDELKETGVEASRSNLIGVRDRRPVSELDPVQKMSIDHGGEQQAPRSSLDSSHLDSADEDPDSGFAFESDSELIEPVEALNISGAGSRSSAHSEQADADNQGDPQPSSWSRHEFSRKIEQLARMAPNHRNVFNDARQPNIKPEANQASGQVRRERFRFAHSST